MHVARRAWPGTRSWLSRSTNVLADATWNTSARWQSTNMRRLPFVKPPDIWDRSPPRRLNCCKSESQTSAPTRPHRQLSNTRDNKPRTRRPTSRKNDRAFNPAALNGWLGSGSSRGAAPLQIAILRPERTNGSKKNAAMSMAYAARRIAEIAVPHPVAPDRLRPRPSSDAAPVLDPRAATALCYPHVCAPGHQAPAGTGGDVVVVRTIRG